MQDPSVTPKNYDPLTVKLFGEMGDQLRQLAAVKGRSRSELVRAAIRKELLAAQSEGLLRQQP